jgi:hypothetical protein
VRHLVLGADTVSYAGFVCDDTVPKAVRYRDTPEYKLWRAVTALPVSHAPLAPGAGVGLALKPLHGEQDDYYSSHVTEELTNVLKSSGHDVYSLDTKWVLANLGNRGVAPRYAVITPQLVGRTLSHAGTSYGSGSIPVLGPGFGGFAPAEVNEAMIEVVAEICVIDLWNTRKLFHETEASTERKTAYDMQVPTGHTVTIGSTASAVERRTRMVAGSIADAVKEFVESGE